MTAYTYSMSNHSSRPSSNDCPTEVIPTVPQIPVRRSILHAAQPGAPTDRPSPARPFADWRDQTPTAELTAALPAAAFPDVPAPLPTRTRTERLAIRRERDRVATRRPRARYHIRAALAGILIAAALLGALQLYAADGIAQARQAALAAAQHDATAATATPTEQASPAPAPTGQSARPAEQWVVEGTTTASPSPLDLPRRIASPDTPLPCLATPDSTRAVILEEDASLTALVRR